MSIRKNTPCDLDGICPYEAENWGNCEYWCGADNPDIFTCDKCGDKNHCAFYEPGAEECPYDYMGPIH